VFVKRDLVLAQPHRGGGFADVSVFFRHRNACRIETPRSVASEAAGARG